MSLPFKGLTFNGRVGFVERIQGQFDISLVHFDEKVFDAIFVLLVVKNEEANPTRGHESRHVPLVEFVHSLEIDFFLKGGN